MTTVSGPYKDEKIAIDVMNTLGSSSHSVYSVAADKVDESGVEYTDFDDVVFFVERLPGNVRIDKIFGYDATEFMARQNK